MLYVHDFDGLFFHLTIEHCHSVAKLFQTPDSLCAFLHNCVHASNFNLILLCKPMRSCQFVVELHQRILHDDVNFTDAYESVHLVHGALCLDLVLELLLLLSQALIHLLNLEHLLHLPDLLEIKAKLVDIWICKVGLFSWIGFIIVFNLCSFFLILFYNLRLLLGTESISNLLDHFIDFRFFLLQFQLWARVLVAQLWSLLWQFGWCWSFLLAAVFVEIGLFSDFLGTILLEEIGWVYIAIHHWPCRVVIQLPQVKYSFIF